MNTEDIFSIDRLLFRRQFLLGPNFYKPNKHWSCHAMARGLTLSIHSDLPLISKTKNGISITLIGNLIDPYHPKNDEADIVSSLLGTVSDIDSLIEAVSSMVGRWVFIFQSDQGTYLFSDPCGLRQVFYYSDGKNVWCASQPEMIKANSSIKFSRDETMWQFLTDPKHAKEESAWVGHRTIYENCFHLMPNHYLRLEGPEQIRFYPRKSLKVMDTEKIIELSCAILQGTMSALAERYRVAMALTAGWDSRVLLAASKHVKEQIEYFVYSPKDDSEKHPDVVVPKTIANKMGLQFWVKRAEKHLPGWFISILSQNVTFARVLWKTHHIYNKLRAGDHRMNVNGNCSEICRNFYDKYCDTKAQDISIEDLAARMFGAKESPEFVLQELSQWKKNIGTDDIGHIDILDLLYWEQRLGNWGAQYPAEQDIAVDEISPFNCRLLIETLLSAPRHLRAAPDYKIYRMMIQHMWPELLAYPINPLTNQSLIGVLKEKIRPYIPSSVVLMLKRMIKS